MTLSSALGDRDNLMGDKVSKSLAFFLQIVFLVKLYFSCLLFFSFLHVYELGPVYMEID